MSFQSKEIPIEDAIRIQESIWQQALQVKATVREASSRLLEHVRSRETFLLEQVELLERAKYELALENVNEKEESNEFSAFVAQIESGIRPLCDAISEFGKVGIFKARKRKLSVESSVDSDFVVLNDQNSFIPTEDLEVDLIKPGFSFAHLDDGTLTDWLTYDPIEASHSGSLMSYVLELPAGLNKGLDFWLGNDSDEQMEEEPEDAGWEQWLHASPSLNQAEREVLFSEYSRFILESEKEEWLVKDERPARVPPLHGDSDCATKCRAVSDPSSVTMEIENLASIAPCIVDDWLTQSKPKDSQSLMSNRLGDLSQWLDKSSKRSSPRLTSNKRKGSHDWLAQSPTSDWLVQDGLANKAKPTPSLGFPEDHQGWLLSEEKPVESRAKPVGAALCRANEKCSSYGECLFDVNCKKGKRSTSEEKEVEEVKLEKEAPVMDAESGEWIKKDKMITQSIMDNVIQSDIKSIVNQFNDEEEKMRRILSQLSLFESQSVNHWLIS